MPGNGALLCFLGLVLKKMKLNQQATLILERVLVEGKDGVSNHDIAKIVISLEQPAIAKPSNRSVRPDIMRTLFRRDCSAVSKFVLMCLPSRVITFGGTSMLATGPVFSPSISQSPPIRDTRTMLQNPLSHRDQAFATHRARSPARSSDCCSRWQLELVAAQRQQSFAAWPVGLESGALAPVQAEHRPKRVA
jgi:hypothetical protein